MFAYLHTHVEAPNLRFRIVSIFHISTILTYLLRGDKEIKALITARQGESIRFNLARWT